MGRPWSIPCFIVALSLPLLGGCEEGNRALLGGDTTVFATSATSFSKAAANLGDYDSQGRHVSDPDFDREDANERARGFQRGDTFVDKSWVVAGADEARDGLGPIFNARSCSSCHLQDGRGDAPEEGKPFLGLLLRLSLPGTDAHGGPRPDPIYGDQLQDRGDLPGIPPEGAPQVTWLPEPGTYPDGTPFTLRRPRFEILSPAYGPFDPDMMLSPRIAPAMIGMGLLEAIPEAHIRKLADPEDLDGDGISGRINRVWDATAKAHKLGRFGWKANQPTVRQQVAGAFLGDMGLTSPVFPEGPCTPLQPECEGAPFAGAPEVRASSFENIVFYTTLLAVPAQRDGDSRDIKKGREAFMDAGCGSCHIETLVTGTSPGFFEVSNQVIHPFTDLLLHDMGEGLADGRPDFDATGSEWRTPPLWGLGLIEAVSGSRFLLHDGRARSPEEAILWHGGEGEASRDAFMNMDASRRDALLRYLESL